jgi:hypothetical protein
MMNLDVPPIIVGRIMNIKRELPLWPYGLTTAVEEIFTYVAKTVLRRSHKSSLHHFIAQMGEKIENHRNKKIQ